MKAKIFRIFLAGILCCFLTAGVAGAATPPAGEEALFTTSTAPDALILLDLSGSMAWNPAGGTNIWGNTSCSGTFYSSSGTGHTTNCSRLAIAKRAIFDILDDNDEQYDQRRRTRPVSASGSATCGITTAARRHRRRLLERLQQADPGDRLEVQPDLLQRALRAAPLPAAASSSNVRERRIGQRRDAPGLGAQRGETLSRCPQGRRHRRSLPPEVRHPDHGRGGHLCLQRQRHRDAVRHVQTAPGDRGQGQGAWPTRDTRSS